MPIHNTIIFPVFAKVPTPHVRFCPILLGAPNLSITNSLADSTNYLILIILGQYVIGSFPWNTSSPYNEQ